MGAPPVGIFVRPLYPGTLDCGRICVFGVSRFEKGAGSGGTPGAFGSPCEVSPSVKPRPCSPPGPQREGRQAAPYS